MDDLMLPSDHAFEVFIGMFDPARFSPDEWALYQYHRLHRTS